MKRLLRFLLSFFLLVFARAVLHRYRPTIVMVTGSVGKTSTKDAVAAVLSSRFFVRKSAKSFNSEFGVPLTILGVNNPWHNPIAWLSLIKRTIALLVLPNHYPNLLVLEVGADRPGDLSRILRIATPNAVVVTRLPEVPVHVEAYASPGAVREEEFSPAHALAAEAPLIVSADDAYAMEGALWTPAKIYSYGMAEKAQVRVSGIGFSESGNAVEGMGADIESDGKHARLVVKGSVGVTQIFPAAAAVATGAAFGIPLEEALGALEAYEPPPGRGRLLAGKQGSVLIDDSYNSSPVAVEKALATLREFPHATRRIAVLGDMLELGRYSVAEHKRIGMLARESADLVVAVGIRARTFADAEGSGEVVSYDNARDAAQALSELVKEGDVVLIKGSQSIRTERIVEALLARAEDVNRLVRQERTWKRKR